MFWHDWGSIGRILVVGTLTYAVLILVLRISGKRTLAKLNAFDFVVTVAFGSALATVALSSDVSFAEGVTTLAVFVAAQFVVSWSSVHLDVFRKMTRSEPSLLVREGKVLRGALASARVTETEIRQAVRSRGYGSLELVGAVVLETDGTLSVIAREQLGQGDALVDASRGERARVSRG